MIEKDIQNNVYLDGVLKEYEIIEIFEYNTSKAFVVSTHDFWVYFLCDNTNDFINLNIILYFCFIYKYYICI